MRLLLALPLLLAVGCATGSTLYPPARNPYAPVRNVAWQAIGDSPFWMLAIGDDRIIFRTNMRTPAATWPRVLPRRVGETRIWETGEGVDRLYVEATRSPCDGENGMRFEDTVTVRLHGGEVRGCGGRLLNGEGR